MISIKELREKSEEIRELDGTPGGVPSQDIREHAKSKIWNACLSVANKFHPLLLSLISYL